LPEEAPLKTKKFDSITMKRDAAEKIWAQIKGKTVEEQLAFWQKGEKELFAKGHGVVSSRRMNPDAKAQVRG
jgi:hypothetical protein